MSKELPKMKTPTAIIWGKQDTVTPPNVAEEFHELLPNSDLYLDRQMWSCTHDGTPQ